MDKLFEELCEDQLTRDDIQNLMKYFIYMLNTEMEKLSPLRRRRNAHEPVLGG
jgi:hypothetical protein